MPGIDEITNVLSQYVPSAAAIILWSSYILLGTAFIVAGFFIYYLSSFNYKIKYWEVIGETNQEGLTIDKLKSNRAKWNKDKTAWILMKPVFAGKTIHPFDVRDIYVGKTVYAFKFHDEYLPARIMLNEKVGTINPVPFYIKNWQHIELKQNEIEFQKSGWWEQNKFYLLTIITVACCLGLAAVTVYLTFRFATPAKEEIRSLTEAIKGITQIGGKPT